jgi:hypothetical protein
MRMLLQTLCLASLAVMAPAEDRLKRIYVKNNTAVPVTITVAAFDTRIQGYVEPGKTVVCREEGISHAAGKNESEQITGGGWLATGGAISVFATTIDEHGVLARSETRLNPSGTQYALICVGVNTAGDPPSDEECDACSPISWGLPQPVRARVDEKTELDTEAVSKAIIDYYDHVGEWAGQYRIDAIAGLLLAEKRGEDMEFNVTYRYRGVDDATQTGIDRRQFTVQTKDGGYTVLRMGGHMSAPVAHNLMIQSRLKTSVDSEEAAAESDSDF